MVKENFLLVSLEEAQSKELAEVLSNDTSRKIMNYLSEKEDSTETAVADALSVPLSTVHYNLQKLKDAGLVTVDEFHYRKKGREVDHYRLANKYVIITQKPMKGIRQQLRNILPVALIIGAAGAVIGPLQRVILTTPSEFATDLAVPLAAKATQSVAETDATVRVAATIVQSSPLLGSMAVWFVLGGLSALGLYFIIERLRSR